MSLNPCTQFKMRLQVTVTMLITFAMCNMCKSEDEFKTGMEGDDVQLQFPYPCSSTRVTLQYGNRVPFYTLAESESISLHAAQVDRFTFKKENESDHCSLYLQINPLKRTDAGTFIFFAYGEDGNINENAFKRIGMHVDFLPGKASCTLNAKHTAGKWAELHCKAPVGSLSGQIECYQNGEEVPPLTEPIETNTELKQTIIVKKTQPVSCCAYAYEQPKDKCTCTDFQWDLANNNDLSGIVDPCHSTTLISSERETRETASYPSNMTTEESIIRTDYLNNSFLWYYVVPALASFLTVISFVVLGIVIFKSKKSKQKILRNARKFENYAYREEQLDKTGQTESSRLYPTI